MALPVLNLESEPEDKDGIKVQIVKPDMTKMSETLQIIVDNTKPIQESASQEAEAAMKEETKRKAQMDIFKEMSNALKDIYHYQKYFVIHQKG